MIDDVTTAEPPRSGRWQSDRRRIIYTSAVLLVVWVLATGALILAGQVVVHSSAITSWDEEITRSVVAHRTAGLTSVMKALTWAGSWIAACALVILVGILAWRRRVSPIAVIVVGTLWLGELAAVTLTKSVVRRPRPPEAVRLVQAHGWSFPSGHTANAVVVFVILALIVSVFVSQMWLRVLTWVIALSALGMVGFSRIELGVHWTTDVISSWIWCAAWILLAGQCRRTLFDTSDNLRQGRWSDAAHAFRHRIDTWPAWVSSHRGALRSRPRVESETHSCRQRNNRYEVHSMQARADG